MEALEAGHGGTGVRGFAYRWRPNLGLSRLGV